jgi:hypothetical protein
MADTGTVEAAAPPPHIGIVTFLTPYLMLMVILFYLVVSVTERCEKGCQITSASFIEKKPGSATGSARE